jgi:hypothetical protein
MLKTLWGSFEHLRTNLQNREACLTAQNLAANCVQHGDTPQNRENALPAQSMKMFASDGRRNNQ